MADTCGWKPPVDVSPHPFPRQMMRLAAAREGPPPEPADGRAESANAAPVHGNPVVPHVAPNDRAQISAHRREGLVPTPPKVDLHGLQLRLPPRAHRLPEHRELPLPRLPATVREAENVEALGSPVAPASPADRREAAELDEARLVRMQRPPQPRQPLAQLGEALLSLLPMLESHDEVIGEAHDHDISARLLLSPPLDPEIEHVVQVKIGQQRTDAPALYRPHLAPCPRALLQHAGVQPFLDESHDAPVRHAVLDELHQPPMVEGVEGNGHTLPTSKGFRRALRSPVRTIRLKAAPWPCWAGRIDAIGCIWCSCCPTAVARSSRLHGPTSRRRVTRQPWSTRPA